MLHRLIVGTAALLYTFAVVFGVLLPLVWHPFRLLTDPDYGQEHQRRGVATWRARPAPSTDAERGIRLDEVRRLRRALADAGVGSTTLNLLQAREQELQTRRRPTPSPPDDTAVRDPVAANARHFLWAVAAASIASVLLALDAFNPGAPQRRRKAQGP
ncbi:hypothetical protein [uncultured Thiohalocapsa sp.]|uniref:hypothetical protein n=1 Tax=uncultured Thiohalocapsa sp. TaxID=768990 RepID=UPI0025E60296|nr:hypothetical protein [uncultured Thiohalocapsa sp.]